MNPTHRGRAASGQSSCSLSTQTGKTLMTDQLIAGGGEGGGQTATSPISSLPLRTTPPSALRATCYSSCWRWSTRCVPCFPCGTATNVKFWRPARNPFARVCTAARHRWRNCWRSPRSAEPRSRPPQRRNDLWPPHTSERPPQASQAAAYPPSSFHLLPILVYRKRHLCRGHFYRQNLFRGFVPACHNCAYWSDTTANCWSLNRSRSPLMGWSSSWLLQCRFGPLKW